jgi:hypothetical protein
VLEAFADGGRRRRRAGPAAATEARRLGNGVVLRSIATVMAVTDRPMLVAEVQAAVEDHLGRAVSRDSINACLSVGARQCRHFERVASGRYRLPRAG